MLRGESAGSCIVFAQQESSEYVCSSLRSLCSREFVFMYNRISSVTTAILCVWSPSRTPRSGQPSGVGDNQLSPVWNTSSNVINNFLSRYGDDDFTHPFADLLACWVYSVRSSCGTQLLVCANNAKHVFANLTSLAVYKKPHIFEIIK